MIVVNDKDEPFAEIHLQQQSRKDLESRIISYIYLLSQ